MSRARSRSGPSCAFPVLDAQMRAKLCTAMGTRVRIVEGVSLFYCARHADEIDAKQAAAAATAKSAPGATSRRLDWSDRTAVSVWWDALAVAVEDLSAVAEDTTRPLRKRRLGPAEARRLFREADRVIRHLLSHGEPIAPLADHGDPSGSGGSPAH